MEIKVSIKKQQWWELHIVKTVLFNDAVAVAATSSAVGTTPKPRLWPRPTHLPPRLPRPRRRARPQSRRRTAAAAVEAAAELEQWR